MTFKSMCKPSSKAIWPIACAALLGACSSQAPVQTAKAPDTGVATLAAAEASTPVPVTAAVATLSPVEAHQTAKAGFVVKSSLQSDRPLEAGDYLWEAEGVEEGPLQIVVDIEATTIYAYRGGVEIGRAHIVYGADEKPTPLGTFKILQKKVDHISNLYGAPMPYMMRLTMDGIAIHASEVDDRYATHGCVGVPDEFAALLFGTAKLGDRVVITNGWKTGLEPYTTSAPVDPMAVETT